MQPLPVVLLSSAPAVDCDQVFPCMSRTRFNGMYVSQAYVPVQVKHVTAPIKGKVILRPISISIITDPFAAKNKSHLVVYFVISLDECTLFKTAPVPYE